MEKGYVMFLYQLQNPLSPNTMVTEESNTKDPSFPSVKPTTQSSNIQLVYGYYWIV
jgi:hypothetical protein